MKRKYREKGKRNIWASSEKEEEKEEISDDREEVKDLCESGKCMRPGNDK